MIKGSIVLDIPQDEVNLTELTAKVQTLLKAKRWQDTATKKGFSGLDMDTVYVDGEPKARILVIWSNDGINGYVKENVTTTQINNIKKLKATNG